MSEQMYFYILIMCGVWSQGIIGSFADEDINESSGFHERQKRVVSYLPGEDQITPIKDVPYIVIIRNNNRIACVGSILAHHVVITIPQCVPSAASRYHVISGTVRTDRGNSHNVTDIRRHFAGHLSRRIDGIALLAVNPPFTYGSNTLSIPMHSGPLLQGTLGMISGWGFNFRSMGPGTNFTKYLRSIEVPIIAHRDCVNKYQLHNIEITDKEVCTYHPQKHSGHTDGGAPLVIQGHLAGVHLWTGLDGDQNDSRFPDVFAILQDSVYSQWITTNVRDIEAHFQSHQK